MAVTLASILPRLTAAVSNTVFGARVAQTAPAPNSTSKTALPMMRARRCGVRAAIRKPPCGKSGRVSPNVKNASIYPWKWQSKLLHEGHQPCQRGDGCQQGTTQQQLGCIRQQQSHQQRTG